MHFIDVLLLTGTARYCGLLSLCVLCGCVAVLAHFLSVWCGCMVVIACVALAHVRRSLESEYLKSTKKSNQLHGGKLKVGRVV